MSQNPQYLNKSQTVIQFLQFDVFTLKQMTKSAKHIKRPKNAWIFYRSEQSKRYANSGMSSNVVSAVLAQQWNNLTFEQQAPYKRQQAKAKALFLADYPGYKYAPVRRKKRVYVTKEIRYEPIVPQHAQFDLLQLMTPTRIDADNVDETWVDIN